MKKITSFIISIIIAAQFFCCVKPSASTPDKTINFYVGTYTEEGNSKGIYQYQLSEDGSLDSISLLAEISNPSFLAKSTNKEYLLAVGEDENGTISTFKINDTNLVYINTQSSGGAHPCFVSINDSNQVMVANYTGGNVGLLQLEENGALSELIDIEQHKGESITERQEAPHAHSAYFYPQNNTTISVDLGTDELLFSGISTADQKWDSARQNILKLKPGSGPRHMAFHPKKKWIYVINELNSSVSLLLQKDDGYKVQSSYSTLTTEYEGENYCADIHITSDGKFLYASNRGHNSIAIFSIANDGSLQLKGYELVRGNWPRNFALSPDNSFLVVANQRSNNIVSFKRNKDTGFLTFISEVNAPAPVCILF